MQKDGILIQVVPGYRFEEVRGTIKPGQREAAVEILDLAEWDTGIKISAQDEGPAELRLRVSKALDLYFPEWEGQPSPPIVRVARLLEDVVFFAVEDDYLTRVEVVGGRASREVIPVEYGKSREEQIERQVAQWLPQKLHYNLAYDLRFLHAWGSCWEWMRGMYLEDERNRDRQSIAVLRKSNNQDGRLDLAESVILAAEGDARQALRMLAIGEQKLRDFPQYRREGSWVGGQDALLSVEKIRREISARFE